MEYPPPYENFYHVVQTPTDRLLEDSSTSSTAASSSWLINWWKNFTSDTDSDNNGSTSADHYGMNFIKAEDVSVDAVVTSLYLNTILFVMLMGVYELLRRRMPAVYSSRKKRFMSGSARMRRQEQVLVSADCEDTDDEDTSVPPSQTDLTTSSYSSEASLPEIEKPLDWIAPVFGVSWRKVRKNAGLDGYFLLRYIRMNLRICTVTSFWFFLILVPLYASGDEENAHGWYNWSVANLPPHSFRMWVPCVFFYFFSGFIVFVIKQEYRHFLEIRQDYLARGASYINPQHHYSIQVESIPYELRSDRALAEYFENLFPGKVHSASVVLKLPDLETASAKCMRSCRRLEKSIACYHATGERPVHIVGRGRISVLGIDVLRLECEAPNCCGDDEDALASQYYQNMAEEEEEVKPPRGTRVDSITYYTQELAAHSRILFRMQQRKSSIAESGNHSLRAINWLDKIVDQATVMANRIMEDSVDDNGLQASTIRPTMPQAENMTSQYGSIAPPDSRSRLGTRGSWQSSTATKKDGIMQEENSEEDGFKTPFSRSRYTSKARKWASRLGLDFVVGFARLLNKQIDVALQGVVHNTMSSTGFVTFLDLATTTCAASAPLTVKSSVLHISMAPEPREIIWENAHVSRTIQSRRELFVNIILFLGIILWSFPLAAIQAFAKAEFLAQIPAMQWIVTIHGGKFTNLVNGYLPVVALLGLLLVLPVVFQIVALKYERRSTISGVQKSMLGRYFYYQLATIYITATAGSLLKSLADILDHPGSLFQLLGQSLPTMVGYFVALLVTKTLAGLPMIFLRVGALSRMMFLRLVSVGAKLTQRELDALYRQENVQYGWEFPTQLLVVVIVYTYAIICPIILPFGVMYFMGALMVYKKQILYVYSPVYESGGAMFPFAVQRTLLGLVCAQVTFIGYTVTRGCYYQPMFLFPLPLTTLYGMDYLHQTYAAPSERLSMERARECDRRASATTEPEQHATGVGFADQAVEKRKKLFDKSSYRQPVLTKRSDEPWTYRRSKPDDAETVAVRAQLRQINRYQGAVGQMPLSQNAQRFRQDSKTQDAEHV